jgi:inner membrane protein
LDSVSQFVLGSAVTAASLGTRVPAWRAVVYGGVLGTLPDLDILIDHGDAILNMTMHRGSSHALFWLTLVSPVVALAIAGAHRERSLFRRWWLAVWLTFVTHAMLDAMTIYGTRLWLPFDEQPVSIGSLFVIDPLYTLPLLTGSVALLVARGRPFGRRWNWWGIGLSTLYAAWSLGVQLHLDGTARAALKARGIAADKVIVSPAPLQTVLWRVVAIAANGQTAYEGFISLADDDEPIAFVPIARRPALLDELSQIQVVRQLRTFADDCVKAVAVDDEAFVVDLRMGAEPNYAFTFLVARRGADGSWRPTAATERRPFAVGEGQDLLWLWRRMWGER